MAVHVAGPFQPAKLSLLWLRVFSGQSMGHSGFVHVSWGDWYDFRNDSLKGKRTPYNRITLTNVMMVDKDGNVHTEGWNPNLFFKDGLEMNVIQRHKTFVTKELVDLTHRGEVVFGKDDEPIKIWRNKYKYSPFIFLFLVCENTTALYVCRN